MTRQEIRTVIITRKNNNQVLTEEEKQIALQYFTEQQIEGMHARSIDAIRRGCCYRKNTTHNSEDHTQDCSLNNK